MRKCFQMIGIFTLLVGSFIYSGEVSMTSKQSDELLMEISSKASNYIYNKVEGIVSGDTIVAGRAGKVVDEAKTYDRMRQIGYFNEKLIYYKKDYPSIRLKDNKDKYVIAGNRKSKEIGFIIKVDTGYDLNRIISILKDTNTKVSFFITSRYLEDNHNQVINLIADGHTIGNLGNEGDYQDSDFIWLKTIITSTKQKNNYCLVTKKDVSSLKMCMIQNSYTIMPIMIDDNPYINVKQNLKNGNIIAIRSSAELENELENIINYINSKGYKILPLERQLKE